MVHASETIGMAESPSAALKSKPDSSIHVGIGAVKRGAADAFASAGNTGAVMATALFGLGRLPGVLRPCLPGYLPTPTGTVVVLDVGANIEVRPEHLVQFAQMGSVFGAFYIGTESPSVALINVGEEPGKGTDLLKETYHLLEETDGIRFVGNVEGRDILQHGADVCICDGFVGNVVLKLAESVATILPQMVRAEIGRQGLGAEQAGLVGGVLKGMLTPFDYQTFGGSPLLGIDGTVVIGHGGLERGGRHPDDPRDGRPRGAGRPRPDRRGARPLGRAPTPARRLRALSPSPPMPSTPRRTAAITAVGHYLPPDRLTNADLEQMVDTNDEWIRSRTGIRERRILKDPTKATAFMSTEASKRCLERAGVAPEDVDCILLATITPDMVFPATACLVQNNLGAERAWGYDISAACSGFLFALTTGARMIESGMHERVLVIGADTMSRIINYQDRATCIIFGDGAGAVLLEPTEDGTGVLDTVQYMDGSGSTRSRCPAAVR